MKYFKDLEDKIYGYSEDQADIIPAEYIELTGGIPDGVFSANTWIVGATEVTTDFELAKEEAHDKRRAKRDAAYKAVDGGSQYIVVSAEGESKRKNVKTPDDAEQTAIDATNTVEELREFINATYPAS